MKNQNLSRLVRPLVVVFVILLSCDSLVALTRIGFYGNNFLKALGDVFLVSILIPIAIIAALVILCVIVIIGLILVVTIDTKLDSKSKT